MADQTEAGDLPRDPEGLRRRILNAMDNVLSHPVIVGREGCDLARALKSYFAAAPADVLAEVAKHE